MSVLRKIVCLIRRKKRDYIARGHLRKVGNKKNNADKKIKVAFFVQLVEIWDKLSCVYDVMKTSNDIEPYIVVVPSFDYRLKDESPAIGAGNLDLMDAEASIDIYGLPRGYNPDLGAYVYTPSDTE